MHGEFVFWPSTKKEITVPNMICNGGEEAFLKMLMQGDDTIVGAGSDFYIGLSGDSPTKTFTLDDLTAEPTVANGYARQSISRDATGFPTVELINGIYRAVSELINFTATGGDFDQAIDRAFLASVGSGTSGVLFAFSGALPAKITLTAGQTLPTRYQLYLN